MRHCIHKSGFFILTVALSWSMGCTKTETTPHTVPVLTGTTSASEITDTTAISGGTISANGGSIVTECGVCWNKTGNPTVDDRKTNEGMKTGTFSSRMNKLESSTQYFVRSYARNSTGVGYGEEKRFTTVTLSPLPIIAPTTVITKITSTRAVSGGNVATIGSSPVTARGVCWSTLAGPTILNPKTVDGAGTGPFVSHISGLSANTKYYVRAYATNSVGTRYGSLVSFTTAPHPVHDIDGNGYDTVMIGDQAWLKQNLKTSRYRDGSPIPTLPGALQWANTTAGAFAIYAGTGHTDSAATNAVFGKLYNLYAVTDTRGLCPAGWHVPTDGEWVELIDYLGGIEGGGKLKAITSLWASPNIGATNQTGFTALPGGIRNQSGVYEQISGFGYFQSSTGSPQSRVLKATSADIEATGNPFATVGASVRCIMD